ncbi:MAG: hypothetical protein WCO98_13880 [bacterium]
MTGCDNELLPIQQELTRLLNALHTLSEKQLSISLNGREELLAKKQILLDELSKRNLSSVIKTALNSNDIKCKEEAAKHIEFLHGIEQLEAITLDRWYKECEKSLKDMQGNSNSLQFKSQYKENLKPNDSRFLDDKR